MYGIKMIDKLIEQQEQIKAMQENEDSAIKIMKMYEDCKKRIDRAIKYIGTFDFDYLDSTYEHNARIVLENILEILKGSDKE